MISKFFKIDVKKVFAFVNKIGRKIADFHSRLYMEFGIGICNDFKLVPTFEYDHEVYGQEREIDIQADWLCFGLNFHFNYVYVPKDERI